jgi:hypothetical protein
MTNKRKIKKFKQMQKVDTYKDGYIQSKIDEELLKKFFIEIIEILGRKVEIV